VPVHLNLTVTDIERSVTFYQQWLGFGPEDRRFDDGTTFVRDSEGTDLALHAGEVSTTLHGQVFHFGFRRDTATEVRDLWEELIAGGVEVIAFDEEPDVVSVKLMDPDGYVIEVYWEP
jgi:catechol 2,3-dioxygenase-like lactoylglutathione lyase family enzyme